MFFPPFSHHTVSKCLNQFKLTLIKAELVNWVLDLIVFLMDYCMLLFSCATDIKRT